MELGVLILSVAFFIPILVLLIGRNSSNRSEIREHPKVQQRRYAVGPCAVAVGVYKNYEDRKSLEKMYSNDE